MLLYARSGAIAQLGERRLYTREVCGSASAASITSVILNNSRLMIIPKEVLTKPAPSANLRSLGAIAQLGERMLCTHEVCGSIPHSSTKQIKNVTQCVAFFICLVELCLGRTAKPEGLRFARERSDRYGRSPSPA